MKMTWTTPDSVQITMTNADLAIIETALIALGHQWSENLRPDSLELALQSRMTLNAIWDAKNKGWRP